MNTVPTKPGVYRKGAVKCEAPTCTNITRSKHASREDYPGTLVRMGRGLCNRCYETVMAEERSQLTELKYPLLPCTVEGCDAMTRSPKDNPALAPGTRRRISHGRCTECYKQQQIPAEKVEAVRTELDAFLVARQKRQAVAERRQAVAQQLRRAS